MQFVVPAAGEGSRLGTLTDDRPKGLVTVAGRPLLSTVFDTAVDAGATELVVIVGIGGDQIRLHYGESYRSVPIEYVEQPEPLGLGDAIHRARELIDTQFTVLNGDNVFVDPIRPAIERAANSDVDGVLLVETATPAVAKKTGVVVLDGAEVIDLVEKPDNPPSTRITTGCCVLPPAVFTELERAQPSDRGEVELATGIDRLIQTGRTIEAVQYHGDRVNVNRPTDIETAEQLLAK